MQRKMFVPLVVVMLAALLAACGVSQSATPAAEATAVPAAAEATAAPDTQPTAEATQPVTPGRTQLKLWTHSAGNDTEYAAIKELDEAAFVDGATRFQIYRHVVVPVSGPVFATVAILTFLGTWNAFLWPIMTVQSEDIRPVMVGMSYFFQQNVQWGEVMAYATLVTIPVLGLFLAFQRSFVQSIAGTGSKEG